MHTGTHILIVEDLETDIELAQREIRKSVKDCVFQHVDTSRDFLKALETFQPDVILSDYSLPNFNGLKALELAQEHATLTPFIIWTGSMSEDVAVECMKAGANNYILKENIKRLGPAVVHAMEERRLLVERRLAEERYQSIFENSAEGIFQSTPEGRYIKVNPAMAHIYGYASPEEMIESITSIADQVYTEPGDRRAFTKLLHNKDEIKNFEMKNLRKDGSVIWTSTSARVVRGADGAILYYEGLLQDITERKQVETEIQHRNDDLKLINAINEAVIRGESLDAIVNLLSKELKRIFSSEGSTIYMLGPDGKSLAMQQYSLPPEITRKIERLIGSTIPLVQIPVQEGGYFHKVLSSQRGSVTSDPAEIQKWMSEFVETSFLPQLARGPIRKLIPRIYKLLRIRSTIIVPLISDGKTIGLLDVSSPNLFTEDDLRRIENISGQLTAAIQRQRANEQIRRSEVFLQSIQNALSASIAILNEEGTIVQVNSAWRKFGEQNSLNHPKYGIGLNYLEICDKATGPYAEEAPIVANAIRDVIMGRKREAHIEYPCHSPEEKRWFILQVTKFDDEDHVWVVLAHENITERKVVEQKIKETSEQFRILFEASPEAIMLVDPQKNWSIMDCNSMACTMNGFTRDELVGQPVDIFNLTQDTPATHAEYLERVRKAGILRYETFHRRKDGTVFPIEVSTSLIMLGGREVVLGIDRDITGRKEAEEAVRKANEKYRNIFENALESIHQTTPDGQYITANPATARILGYESPEELMASVTDLNRKFYVDPNRREEFKALMDEYGFVSGFESEVYRKDGSTICVSENVRTIRDEQGNVLYYEGTSQDITERKRAEKALRESEEKYRLLFDSNPLPMWIYDLETLRFLKVNDAAVNHYGYSEEEFMAMTIKDIRPAADIPRLIKNISHVDQGIDKAGVWSHVKKDGSIIHVEIISHVVEFNGHRAELVLANDVTERKQAETQINELLTFNEKILNNSPIGILAYRHTGECTFANETAASIIGTEVERLRLQNYHEITSWKTSGLYELAENAMRGNDALISDLHLLSTFGKDAWLTAHCVKFKSNEEDNLLLLISDITKRKQAERAESDQRALAEALRNTAEILNSTLDYGEVLDHILTAVGSVVPHDAATILLIEEDSAHVARMQGYDSDTRVAKLKFPLDKTPNLKQMHETRRSMVIPKTHSFSGWRVLPDTEWVQSNVGAPISIFGEVVGYILLDSKTAGFFTPVHAERLEAFANQAALAIHNSRLLQQAQQEIAERKQAEQELRASEERFRQLADNIQEVFWMTDAISGEELYISPASEKIWGRSIDNMLSSPESFILSVVPEDRPHVQKMIAEQRNGVNTEMEYRILRDNGSICWIWDRAFPIFDESGKVVRLAGIAADITERKQAEEQLRKLSRAVEQSASTIVITDTQGNIEYVNPKFTETTGYSVEEAIGQNPRILKSDFTPQDEYDRLWKKIQSGEEWHGEFLNRKKNGELYWESATISPIINERGEATHFLAVKEDITERKQAEEALRKNEQRLRIALASTNIAVFNQDTDLRYTWMYQPQLGYTSEQVIGRTDEELLPSQDVLTITEIKRRAMETGRPQRAEVSIHSGDQITYYDMIVEPLLGSDGTIVGITGSTLDITSHKSSEIEIRRHLSEMEALYENGLAVGQLLNPREIGERIIATFSRHLSWHHVTIRLLQEGSDELKLISFNLPHMDAENTATAENQFISHVSRVGQGLSGWVVQTGKPFRTGNLQEHPQYVNTYEGMQSGLYMPLKVGERVTGVISVESESPDAFTPQDERLLATLASQAAVAFENARLYQSIQQERERFSELFENSPVATWLEDFSAVIDWMNGLRAQGVTNLKEYLEKNPEEFKASVRLIRILDVNHVAVVMNGARNKEELIDNVHALMEDDTPSEIMINELELIWRGYTSFGFEMTSHKLDGSLITGIQRIYIPASDNKPDYARVIVTSTDITDRVNFEKQLRTSEVHYRELADSITDIFFELDQNLRYSHWNKASETLTGLPAEYAIGKSMRDVFGESEEQERIEQIYRNVLEKHQPRTFETVFYLNSLPRAFEINAYPSTRGVAVVAKDVTERKRSESLMQKRFELMEFSAEHTLEELMQKALDEISEWTHSAIGFFQFIQEDQLTPGIQVWSTDTFQHFQLSGMEEMHKPADQAGVWADAIRQRRAVIHNDYASLRGKKGLPEGHISMVREMIVPIIRNERIMAAIGIGNKSQEYTREDLDLMERFADYAWDIIERKQMVIELAEERNQLAKRVEERTADLSRANSNLARALRVKDEFLANMSHELRTPLNAILGLSESLAEQIAGPLNDKQLKYITTISESGHHLLSLINDILDLAKIEAGQITLDINKVDVNSVSQASLRMIKQLAQKKNLDVSVEIDKNVGLMWADERRLKQMMVNLLSNAVKFTPEGGKIGLQIDGDQDDNKVTITIWDTGIGIKQGDFERLFQPFVQLDSGLARESSGTGLGLALVAQMARMHGGSVNVHSDPGKGSRFTIVLPWEPALTMDAAERLKVTSKFRAIRPGQAQQTILLIEDTQEVVMMIKDYLEIAGYKVVTAQDGLDGITQAKLTHPDLILMDIQMPRMDGLEATEKLRQEHEFKYTPIIALTALAMPNDRERCLAAGMDEYISKPVNLRALVKIIQASLSNREEKTQPR